MNDINLSFVLEKEAAANGYFPIKLEINTRGNVVNAIEGEIVFNADFLEIAGINEGTGVVSLWVEKPQAKDNIISFSGVTPGGFQGEAGVVMSVRFKAKKVGQTVIDFKRINVFLHDGQGSQAKVTIKPLMIDIAKEAAIDLPMEEDSAPPEPFEPLISKSIDIFDNKFFAVFATQDKESGIDHYEIHEARYQITPYRWSREESPYLLKDQELKSYVYVKAVDRLGNERVAVLYPQLPWYKNALFLAIIVIGIIAIIALWLTHQRKKF